MLSAFFCERLQTFLTRLEELAGFSRLQPLVDIRCRDSEGPGVAGGRAADGGLSCGTRTASWPWVVLPTCSRARPRLLLMVAPSGSDISGIPGRLKLGASQRPPQPGSTLKECVRRMEPAISGGHQSLRHGCLSSRRLLSSPNLSVLRGSEVQATQSPQIS